MRCDTWDLDQTTRPMRFLQGLKCIIYIFMIPFTTSLIVAGVGLLLQGIF